MISETEHLKQEARTLAYLLQNEEVYALFRDHVSPDLFTHPVIRENAKLLLGSHARLGHFPSEVTEALYLGEDRWRDLDPLKREPLLEGIRLVYAADPGSLTADLLRRQILSRRIHDLGFQALGNSSKLEEVDELCHSLRDGLETLLPLIGRSEALTTDALAPNTISQRKNIYRQIEETGVVPTGFPRLDQLVRRGGLRLGHMGIWLAGTGMGKSLFLVVIGAHACVRLKKNVLYISLAELDESDIIERLDACILGHKMGGERELGDLSQRLQSITKDSGSFLVASLIQARATVSDLERIIVTASIRLGQLDLVIVDYGDVLKPPTKRTDVRHELRDTFVALAGVAKRRNVAMWVATQGNARSMYSPHITLQNLSEAFSKAWPSPLVVGLKQSYKERALGVAELVVLKNTRGKVNQLIPVEIDYATNRAWERLDAPVRDLIPVETEAKEGRR